MARADRHVDQRERVVIEAVATQLGFTELDVISTLATLDASLD